MTEQEELELKNIVAAMIAVAYPKQIKYMFEAYDVISRGVLDSLVAHGISDDEQVEKMLGNVLMHLMRQGLNEKFIDIENISPMKLPSCIHGVVDKCDICDEKK